MAQTATSGTIVFDDGAEDKLTIYRAEHDAPNNRDGTTEKLPHPGEQPLTAQIRHFVECVRPGRRTEVDFEAGARVVLLEAGGDPRALSGGDPAWPDADQLPADYDVPAFHASASENEALSWNFFVRHYADDAMQRSDPKYRAEHDGVSRSEAIRDAVRAWTHAA